MKYLILRTKPQDPTRFEVYREDGETPTQIGDAGTRRSAESLVRLDEQGLLKPVTKEQTNG